MKSGAYLINTSRGPVLNEADVADALKSGRLAGAGVDVLSAEPAREDNPLLTCDKCIITPHIAWASFEARDLCIDEVILNIKAFKNGSPRNSVN